MATTALTTSTQISNRLSATGLALRVDHAPTGATAEAITSASADVQFYLANRYGIPLLSTSDWVSSKATTIAIWYLCTWRNNGVPKSIQDMYEKVLIDLQLVQSGKANAPGISLAGNAPQVVTQRVDWDRYPHERVVAAGTVGTGSGFTEYQEPYEPYPV